MEKPFESWKKRKLTIFGKACIVNSLAISKMIYVGSILPMPDPEYIKQLKIVYLISFGIKEIE